MNDRLAKIEHFWKDDEMTIYDRAIAPDVLALVEIAKAARECVILAYDPARTGAANAELHRRASRLRDALSVLGDREAGEPRD